MLDPRTLPPNVRFCRIECLRTCVLGQEEVKSRVQPGWAVLVGFERYPEWNLCW